MMELVIYIEPYFSQATLLFDPVSSFKYFRYNIKQTCIFKSLLLGVLCANHGHFLPRLVWTLYSSWGTLSERYLSKVGMI